MTSTSAPLLGSQPVRSLPLARSTSPGRALTVVVSRHEERTTYDERASYGALVDSGAGVRHGDVRRVRGRVAVAAKQLGGRDAARALARRHGAWRRDAGERRLRVGAAQAQQGRLDARARERDVLHGAGPRLHRQAVRAVVRHRRRHEERHHVAVRLPAAAPADRARHRGAGRPAAHRRQEPQDQAPRQEADPRGQGGALLDGPQLPPPQGGARRHRRGTAVVLRPLCAHPCAE